MYTALAVGIAVFRGMFVSNTEEVTGGRRKINTEELHNLYYSPNNVRVIK
jgi:hypothetical protein